MSAPIPTVSVSLVTYNHERYIGETIRSVLGQTFSDLEVVVVDDGSTDRTPEVIASFDDPRLISIRQENQGPGAATNRALAACRGKYVTLLSGDDVCYPDRIQKQLEAYACGGPRLLFASATFIDEDGAPIPPGPYEDFFDLTPQTRAEIYRRFFFRGNFINAVTAFTERRLLGEAPYDPLLYQTQDFDLWIRLVKRHEISFQPEPVIRYRIRANQQNLSSPRAEHQVRTNNEYLFLMRRFFDDVPLELFREAFGGELRRPDFSSPDEALCEQAFLLLRAPHPMQEVVGLERLYDLLTTPRTAAVLRDRYAFTYLDFVELLTRTDPLRMWGQTLTSLFVDTGKGFNSEEVRQQTVFSGTSAFTLTFDLSGFSGIRSLRWEPVWMRHCRVELRHISWRDRAGQSHSLDPAGVSSNGTRDASGGHCFETHNPMFFLLVGEDIAGLTLEGRWDIKDLYGTCVRTAQLWATACGQRDEAQQRVHQLSGEIIQAQQRVHQLSGEIIQARELAASREEELLLLQSNLSYRIGNRLCRLRSRLAPEPTWRYRLYRLVRRAAQIWRTEGARSLHQRIVRRCLHRNA
jgi:glycosyltransferase involved in cell wall biosynthesis